MLVIVVAVAVVFAAVVVKLFVVDVVEILYTGGFGREDI